MLQINKTMKKFEDFRTGVFDDKGKYLLERTYAAKPGKVCKFCEFYDVCDIAGTESSNGCFQML